MTIVRGWTWCSRHCGSPALIFEPSVPFSRCNRREEDMGENPEVRTSLAGTLAGSGSGAVPTWVVTVIDRLPPARWGEETHYRAPGSLSTRSLLAASRPARVSIMVSDSRPPARHPARTPARHPARAPARHPHGTRI